MRAAVPLDLNRNSVASHSDKMGSMFSSQDAEEGNWKSDARYAMESGTYCVICGGLFDIEGDVYNLDPKEPSYRWLYDFRLLGHCEDLDRHRVTSGSTEPLNTSNIKDIFLSEKASFSMNGAGAFEVVDETGSEDIWYNALWYEQNSTNSLFALHDACIEIGCRVIDHVRGGAGMEPSLALLYQFLNTRFLDSHMRTHRTDDTANDILDLCQVSLLYGPRSVLALSRLGWWGGEYDKFYANPMDIPDHEAFVFNILAASSNKQETTTNVIGITREPQGIERLPAELLDAICSYLPAQSVIKLHRTSKLLAMKLPLDNAFWRDSLRDGSLHPHIWDLDTNRIEALRQEAIISISAAGWDWRSVAKLLATKRFLTADRDARLDDMPLGFWNRCRIWSIIEEAVKHERVRSSIRIRSDSCLGVPRETKT